MGVVDWGVLEDELYIEKWGGRCITEQQSTTLTICNVHTCIPS